MKKFIALLLVVLTVLLCGCSMGDGSIRFGAAGLGGVYHQAATSLKQLAENDSALKIEVKTTAGSAANVRLLSQGYLDAAIAQSDIISSAHITERIHLKQHIKITALLRLFTPKCAIL